MTINELWDTLLVSVKKSYDDAIKIANSDGITPICASAMRTTVEGLVKLFYLKFYRKAYDTSFKLSKSIKNEDFRKHFTGAEYADIDSIRFVGNEQVHFMFSENIKDDDVTETFFRAVNTLQEKLKINIIGNNRKNILSNTVPKEIDISNDSQEKWNYIIAKRNENYTRSETAVQRDWEAIFSEIFGFKRVNNEIKSQLSIQIGSGERIIADIVISKDDKYVFVAELKQYKLPFTLSMERQIISYFNQLHISIGILVCEKLYLYAYNYAENIIDKLEISFEKNNSNGLEFVELFNKQNYNESQIRAFIKEQSNLAVIADSAIKYKSENSINPFFSSGIVHRGQRFNVSTNAELLNTLLGTKLNGWMKCSYSLTSDKKYEIVMLPESETINGWTNSFDESKGLWYEDFVGLSDEKLSAHKGLPPTYRAVFKKWGYGQQRYYTFIGVYELSKESIPNHRISTIISETEDFSKYNSNNKPYHKL